jgi:hypothetical protein
MRPGPSTLRILPIQEADFRVGSFPVRGRTLLPGLVKGSVSDLPECPDVVILHLGGLPVQPAICFRVVPWVQRLRPANLRQELLGESSFSPHWNRAASDEATFNPRQQIPEPEEYEY